MATAVLNKIRRRAVEIQRKHPGKNYQTALQEAGREYRAGKIGKAKKVGAKKKSRYVPVKAEHCRKIGSVADMTLAQSLSKAKRKLEEQIAWLHVQKTHATTKTARNKLQNRISDLNYKLRALS